MLKKGHSFLRWKHLPCLTGGAELTQTFLTSQNQVLTREPEVFRRSDATVQPKGQILSAGKQSFGFNDPKIWPYVFVDSSWVVQPNADFPHPWDAHEILELEGQGRDPPRCRWGAAFHKPDKKLTVCFCMTKTYMHNVPFGLEQPSHIFTDIMFLSPSETWCLLVGLHSSQSKNSVRGVVFVSFLNCLVVDQCVLL